MKDLDDTLGVEGPGPAGPPARPARAPLPVRLLRSRVVWLLAAVLAVCGLSNAGFAAHDAIAYGSRHTERQPAFTVDVDQRFTLVLEDLGGSVGDHWTVRSPPDGVKVISSELVGSYQDRMLLPLAYPFGLAGAGCCAGDRYLTFELTRPGAFVITANNCFQGCRRGADDPRSRDVSWTVTAR
jgi:hypothetical protein